MSGRLRMLLAGALLASASTGFLVSNSPVGGGFVFESLPASLRPADLLVDTEPVSGVADPLAVTQDLMNQWNLVDAAEDVFGTASAGGPYDGSTVGQTFGVFTNTQHEVAFDDTGEILAHFGISPGVLGITIKSVDTSRGRLLDFLVVINTQPGALTAPGTGATTEELFRATLVHELGHAVGLGHTPIGMVNVTTFGLFPAPAARIPTMYPFRLPLRPQEGGTIEGDDVAALVQVYPEDPSGLGSISGTVRGASGSPVNEIVVRVIGPLAIGDDHIGVLTNADGSDQGRFLVPNLAPGSYRVILEAVNGRGSIDEMALASGSDSLGGNPFLHAIDEMWRPGDTYDPALDVPNDGAVVQVRAGRDTGSLDFVLNGTPLDAGPGLAGTLQAGDSQLPDPAGGFHYADYFVFRGNAGDDLELGVTTNGFTPQLRLLRPSDFAVLEEVAPFAGASAQLSRSLPQSGIYTLVLYARASTGNPGGSGTYVVTLQGSGGSLPAVPAVTPAQIARGAADPGAQQFASPLCELPVLQLQLTTPSHEELWLDRVSLRASGSADDRDDVTAVNLVHDLDGDGRRDGGEPLLATGTFSADDGTLVFDQLDAELEPGTRQNLLVTVAMEVTSVSSAGIAVWWFLPALLPLFLLRRARVAALLLALALAPLSCGGGGGSGCNGPFDPDGAVVTFQLTLDPGAVEAYTPTSDPGSPLTLVTTAIASGVVSVSN